MDDSCVTTEPGHSTDRDHSRLIMGARHSGTSCQVTSVGAEGGLTLRMDGKEMAVWHHNPVAILGVLVPEGHEAIFVESQSALLVRKRLPNSGWHGFNVATGSVHSPCCPVP